MKHLDRSATLKAIVTEDFRAAAVFERYSLDFCCKGGVTIAEACAGREVDPAGVYADLEEALRTPGDPDESGRWTPDTLIDHIIRTHHAYVRSAIPVLSVHTRKIADVHGPNHPEVIAIAAQFGAVAAELLHHMQKEEMILFPYIMQMAAAARQGRTLAAPGFGSAHNPIRMMEAEHAAAGDALYGIRALSNTYTPPPDACTTYRVTYQELRQFEEDLHRHVHLENNILFPSALALEREIVPVTTTSGEGR